MKILNLYASVGGNRAKWGTEHKVTAVELNAKVAAIYKERYPQDTLIIGDAHEYLLKHYKEFDLIFVSRSCVTHSRARYWATGGGNPRYNTYEPVYPDFVLYEEIVFLQHFCKTKFVVENVVPYYASFVEQRFLIKPTAKIGKHWFWANFTIAPIKGLESFHFATISELERYKGIDLSKYEKIDKRKILRDMMHPDMGLHLLNCALQETQLTIENWDV